MLKKPESQKPGVFSFTDPLHRHVWLAIFAAMLGVTVVLFVIRCACSGCVETDSHSYGKLLALEPSAEDTSAFETIGRAQLHLALRVGRRDECSGATAGASPVLAVQLVLVRALRLHAAVARREPQVRRASSHLQQQQCLNSRFSTCTVPYCTVPVLVRLQTPDGSCAARARRDWWAPCGGSSRR